ncbi:alpha/beta hydrolase [Telmatospirillum sp. J64-1]|uniref:alpha/beta hydrolase n=1 Tax=Telmatospirillum sp. J64-1 TaxID=2502183 RepID=UPI00210416D9|nr:alpha/beta hydrolase [Telmatospirillum sp. J64-1]
MPLRSWLPEGQEVTAAVVALHGFNDYSKAYTGAGEHLSARGVAVYAYDQRGFGQAPFPGIWAGADALVEDAKRMVAMVRERHPGVPVYLLGESMGGAVVMATMTRPNPPEVDGVILSAPAVWGRSTMNPFQSAALWVVANTFPSLKLSGKGVIKVTPSDNIEMLRALSRDPLVIKETRADAIYGLVDLMDEALAAGRRLTVPTLVLYGERDEIVPPRPTFRMISELPRNGASPTVALYPQGYHLLMRDLQAEVVLNDIAAWINNPGQPLPSRADRRAAERLAEQQEAGGQRS